MPAPMSQVATALPLCFTVKTWMKWAGIGLLVALSLLRPCSIGWVINVRIWVLPSKRLVRILMLDILTSAAADGDFNFFFGAVAGLFPFGDGKDKGRIGYF